MSKVPVLIAARNEADFIGRTLDAVPRQAEPIVIPNGCTDKTAEIAGQYGARVIDPDVEGKMTAIQAGISFLGRRAIEPFITLDADSYPVFPKYWLDALLETRTLMPEDKPAVVTGAAIYKGGTSPVSSLYRTIRNLHMQYAARNDQIGGLTFGGNMLVHPATYDVVEQIQALPQIWPGEDATIKTLIVNEGGAIRRSLHPGAMVFSDSSRYPGLWRRIVDGKQKQGEQIMQSYQQDAPPNSITGREYKEKQSSSALAA